MQKFSGSANGQLLRDDDDSRRFLRGDEIPEVFGHGLAVMRDEDTPFTSRQSKHVRVVNMVSAESERGLKIYARVETFGGDNDALVKVIIGLKAQLHERSAGAFRRMASRRRCASGYSPRTRSRNVAYSSSACCR